MTYESFGYWLLNMFFRRDLKNNHPQRANSAYANVSKIDVLLGAQFWKDTQGKTVIEFGAGIGLDAVEIARRGASRVIGLEIQDNFIEKARIRAEKAGLSN